eukprot:1394344-Amorphochlora_amoeboformis.AAC.1
MAATATLTSSKEEVIPRAEFDVEEPAKTSQHSKKNDEKVGQENSEGRGRAVRVDNASSG